MFIKIDEIGHAVVHFFHVILELWIVEFMTTNHFTTTIAAAAAAASKWYAIWNGDRYVRMFIEQMQLTRSKLKYWTSSATADVSAVNGFVRSVYIGIWLILRSTLIAAVKAILISNGYHALSVVVLNSTHKHGHDTLDLWLHDTYMCAGIFFPTFRYIPTEIHIHDDVVHTFKHVSVLLSTET